MSSILKVDQIQLSNGNTPTAGDLGLNTTGSVLQVIKNESTAATVVTSSSYVTSVSANITPSATSSRVKISVCGIYYANHTGSNVSNLFTCHRNGSPVSGHNWSQGSGSTACHYLQYRTDRIGDHIPLPFNFTWIDSPSTTSSTTYAFKTEASVGQHRFYSGVTMILEEIAG